jgi:hypothetical protein
MASTFSTALRLELMATGDQTGTWGDTTNTNLGTLLEQAITGVLSVVQGDVANLTLTTNNGASDQARNAVLKITGALTADRNVVVPAVNKVYLAINATTGAHSLTFKTPSGTGVTVPNGQARWVYSDGTNVNDATGTLGVAFGGTGLTSGTSGGILGFTASGTIASSVALTANALVLGGGAGATPTPMASLGTSTQVLHGNASGAPTWGQVAIGSDVSGLATGVATFLATPSSANLRAAMTDETGTGLLYFQGGALGTPASGVATNLTGTASGLTAGAANAVPWSGVSSTPTTLAGYGITDTIIKSVKTQVFTGSGTYTPSSGMAYAIIEAVGGGGGGGGAASASSGQLTGAGGGGSGAYSRKLVTAADVGASKTVTIGAAGSGGAAGNNSGGTGGDTSVGTLCVAKGGSPGGGVGSSGGGSSGAGGLASGGTGDVKIDGGNGFNGRNVTSGASAMFLAAGGPGGTSVYGAGGIWSCADIGQPASGYGGGGGGASSLNSGGTKAGGAGTPGLVIITEYCTQ